MIALLLIQHQRNTRLRQGYMENMVLVLRQQRTIQGPFSKVQNLEPFLLEVGYQLYMN